MVAAYRSGSLSDKSCNTIQSLFWIWQDSPRKQFIGVYWRDPFSTDPSESLVGTIICLALLAPELVKAHGVAIQSINFYIRAHVPSLAWLIGWYSLV